MRGQIILGSGMKIKRAATISDNAKTKNTLRQVRAAIAEGKLDSVLTLQTYDVVDLGREDEVKHAHNRHMTISELDKHIEENRKDGMDSIDFALTQMDLFSKYLKKNVHAGTHGYSALMVLNFMTHEERRKLLEIILSEREAIISSGFVEGQFCNVRGGLETLFDRLDVTLDNKYHNQELVEN